MLPVLVFSFTRITLNKLTREVFHPHDDELLKYLLDDKQRIKPKW